METHEKRDLYSITGLFIEDHSPNQQVYFGGFFSLSEQPGSSCLSSEISGGLLDGYGASEISGELDGEKICFQKTYVNRSGAIDYQFRLAKEGVWEGTYNGGRFVGKGRAVCRTHLDWEGMDIITPGRVNPETWAKNIINDMVERGFLKVTKDPQTGEDFVSPGKKC